MKRFSKPVIAGNWKMHQTPAEARAFMDAFLPAVGSHAGTIAIFPPAISLAAAIDGGQGGDRVVFGVQNIHWEEKGAFTGEISASMARTAGAALVLVGHSERRHVFGETDAETAKKVRAALDAGITPVLCVGETLHDREGGRADEVVARQLAAVADAISTNELGSIIIAYEPVWAIGTGRTASPEDASAMHTRIREFLRERLGDDASARVPILYGGSVKPENAGELLRSPEIDGVLVGGASLDPTGFARICEAAG